MQVSLKACSAAISAEKQAGHMVAHTLPNFILFFSLSNESTAFIAKQNRRVQGERANGKAARSWGAWSVAFMHCD